MTGLNASEQISRNRELSIYLRTLFHLPSSLVIVDASNQCHDVVFNLGGGTGQTRSWDIKVTQFTCNQELGGEMKSCAVVQVNSTFSSNAILGPEGCLQYFIGTSGTISR